MFSLENCLDDFIMMCFMLGNDFLPSMPSLKINKNGLDILLENYCNLFKTNREYLTHNEFINKSQFCRLLKKIAENEEENLLKIYNNSNNAKTISPDPSNVKSLLESVQLISNKHIDKVRLGQPGYRDRFYYNYFKISPSEHDFKKSLKVICQNYYDGLVWTFKYYKKGCADWNWCYNYHQSPLTKDFLLIFDDLNFSKTFNINKPVSPFTQLLSVLPPESNHLLPTYLAEQMVNDDSSIIDLFPTEYQLDYMGNKFLWQCHPILPIPDIKRIIRIAEKTILTKEETIRNKHGKDKLLKVE